MGHAIRLTAADGQEIGAWRADPPGYPKVGHPKAGLVVIQEIFGLNRHIRDVTEGFAAEGYLAVAPALFDRIEPDVELGYDAAAVARGRSLRERLPWDQVLADVAAAMKVAATAGRVGIVGYCWGATVAWMAAARLNLDAAVAYYGTGIYDIRSETPRCPLLAHFGEKDGSLPPERIAAIRRAQPQIEIQVYAGAEHGFNCDHRSAYQAEAAALARGRTLAFFEQNLIKKP